DGDGAFAGVQTDSLRWLRRNHLRDAVQRQATLEMTFTDQDRVQQGGAAETWLRFPGSAMFDFLHATRVVRGHLLDVAALDAAPQRLVVRGGAYRRVDFAPLDATAGGVVRQTQVM